ncbi:substrate-binding domain-containing protein [Rhizobium sp. RM]|uniref:substrate-binding domain-containing protein n=1 Tax=Rhizobium sp. RM TaxID=2748079 RepID=UPI00110E3200|nr:substrate-binding domain-containing protein [Rhizobium sp. RM]NWJ25296.1 substrate-binding domain-containing protein [Rhizobium sp. RM]TMV17613.1 sugar ABC transporter substrate-binding protein [Rhizobium sp. Td3]
MKQLLMTTSLCLTLAIPAMASDTRVAVSMTSFDNPFLTILLNGIRGEAERNGKIELLTEDAQLDPAKQLNQVQNFIANGVDAMIVNAVDGDATAAITKAAADANVPLVYVNHPPAELDAGLPEGTAFVGSNELDSGTMEAQAACKLLGGKGKAVILMGPLENHAALVRTKDVEDVFSKPECNIEILEKQTANWNRTQAQDLVSSWLTAGIEFDAVIANNDEMAIGAAQALKAAGKSLDKIVIAGIDATPDGLAAMKAGDIDITVYQNATKQGEVAAQAAVKMAGGEKSEKTYWVPFELVTPENMASYAK